MNILYIVDGYYPSVWWGEILFQYLAEAMVKKWHKVSVLTLRSPKAQEHHTSHNGVSIYRVQSQRMFFALFGLRKAIQLAGDADVIHTATYASALLARFTAKILHKKIVITIHEVYHKLWFRFLWFFKGFLPYWWENIICSLPFDHYIGPSLYTVNSIRILYGKRDKDMSLIYHGIDYENWNKNRFTEQEIQNLRYDLWLQENYVWLYFGRAGVGKWFVDLINSISLIAKEIPNFTCFMILSFTPEWPREKVEDLIQRLWIQPHIVLHDSVSYKELPKYILMSDLAIVPSHAEWFWFAAAEVSALWHPLVTTQIASLPEVVSGKIVFCKPWSQESIANSIVSMYQWKCSVLSEKKFEWTECIEKHLDLYRKVLWK